MADPASSRCGPACANLAADGGAIRRRRSGDRSRLCSARDRPMVCRARRARRALRASVGRELGLCCDRRRRSTSRRAFTNRQAGGARRPVDQALAAHLRRDGAHAAARRARRRDPRDERDARRCGSGRPRVARVVIGGGGYPELPGRQRDSDRRAHHCRRGRLRRDDAGSAYRRRLGFGRRGRRAAPLLPRPVRSARRHRIPRRARHALNAPVSGRVASSGRRVVPQADSFSTSDASLRPDKSFHYNHLRLRPQVAGDLPWRKAIVFTKVSV